MFAFSLFGFLRLPIIRYYRGINGRGLILRERQIWTPERSSPNNRLTSSLSSRKNSGLLKRFQPPVKWY
jgi:hypothetical protein